MIECKKLVIVGLVGYKGSGKTTAAEGDSFLQKTILSFADGFKEMLCTLLQVDRDELERLKLDEDIKVIGDKNVRQLMDSIGTDWGRDLIDPGIWADSLGRSLDKLDSETEESRLKLVYVPDVRRLNEAKVVTDRGGIIVRIHGKSNPDPIPEVDRDIPHIHYHADIYNNETPAHLIRNLEYLVTTFIRKRSQQQMEDEPA